MKTNTFINSGIAFLLVLAFAGAASAGETLADRNEFNFNAPLTKSDIAAKNFVYDENYWVQTESTIEESADNYNFDTPTTKADIAAINHHYNKETLNRIGTEAGNWEYRPVNYGAASNKSVADKNVDQKALCSDC